MRGRGHGSIAVVVDRQHGRAGRLQVDRFAGRVEAEIGERAADLEAGAVDRGGECWPSAALFRGWRCLRLVRHRVANALTALGSWSKSRTTNRCGCGFGDVEVGREQLRGRTGPFARRGETTAALPHRGEQTRAVNFRVEQTPIRPYSTVHQYRRRCRSLRRLGDGRAAGVEIGLRFGIWASVALGSSLTIDSRRIASSDGRGLRGTRALSLDTSPKHLQEFRIARVSSIGA